jgi:small nuclear ribonucleoprotein (snRNP)-like protein
MSKRLIRVTPSEIKSKEGILQKQPLNAILSNGNTVFGRLISIDAAQLVLKDTRNHQHQIALSDLYEVVYDDSRGIVPPSRHATL